MLLIDLTQQHNPTAACLCRQLTHSTIPFVSNKSEVRAGLKDIFVGYNEGYKGIYFCSISGVTFAFESATKIFGFLFQ